MSSAFGLLFLAVAAFIVVVGVIVVVNVAKTFARAARNNSPRVSGPRQSAEAVVVDKRTQLTGGGETSSWQHYYVTFQLTDGNRVELEVPATESGMLVVGDQGTLDWQGLRYLGFARQIMR